MVISLIATIVLLMNSWNRPSTHIEEALADLERQRIPIRMQRKVRGGGTRRNPLGFKNTRAAIARSNDTQEVIWARVESDPGVWQIFPGGAVIQWPEG